MQTRVHIHIHVRDLGRSTAFYETLFGQPASKRRPDYANFRLDEPALHLALAHEPGHESVSTEQHFGVELFDDQVLADWRGRVAALAPRIEQQVTCCYAVADKFWVRDPDGNEWEFWVRHEEAEAMHAPSDPASEGCCAPMPLSTLPGTDAHEESTGADPEPCCGGS